MEQHFASLYSNVRLSDAELVLKVQYIEIGDDEPLLNAQEVVYRLPVHLAVVTQSPYFAAQVWPMSAEQA